MVTINTERLTLRELQPSDLNAVHEYASDPEVVRFMYWGPNTVEETREFIRQAINKQKAKPRTDFTLAIVLKPKRRLIGSCGICISSPENREAWIGYCLNRSFWGKGYATETAKALVRFGFEKHMLHRIFATCVPLNKASARVMEKVGLKYEGRLREQRWVKGEWRDSLVYSILEQEWNQK
jgi:RimJ/RimL family protein N-acetyltransferase